MNPPLKHNIQELKPFRLQRSVVLHCLLHVACADPQGLAACAPLQDAFLWSNPDSFINPTFTENHIHDVFSTVTMCSKRHQLQIASSLRAEHDSTISPFLRCIFAHVHSQAEHLGHQKLTARIALYFTWLPRFASQVLKAGQ